MPIFRAKSVKFTPGNFFLHRHVCGVCDKYEVCTNVELLETVLRNLHLARGGAKSWTHHGAESWNRPGRRKGGASFEFHRLCREVTQLCGSFHKTKNRIYLVRMVGKGCEGDWEYKTPKVLQFSSSLLFWTPMLSQMKICIWQRTATILSSTVSQKLLKFMPRPLFLSN